MAVHRHQASAGPSSPVSNNGWSPLGNSAQTSGGSSGGGSAGCSPPWGGVVVGGGVVVVVVGGEVVVVVVVGGGVVVVVGGEVVVVVVVGGGVVVVVVGCGGGLWLWWLGVLGWVCGLLVVLGWCGGCVWGRCRGCGCCWRCDGGCGWCGGCGRRGGCRDSVGFEGRGAIASEVGSAPANGGVTRARRGQDDQRCAHADAGGEAMGEVRRRRHRRDRNLVLRSQQQRQSS